VPRDPTSSCALAPVHANTTINKHTAAATLKRRNLYVISSSRFNDRII
jgi:hypothetical protein